MHAKRVGFVRSSEIPCGYCAGVLGGSWCEPHRYLTDATTNRNPQSNALRKRPHARGVERARTKHITATEFAKEGP